MRRPFKDEYIKVSHGDFRRILSSASEKTNGQSQNNGLTVATKINLQHCLPYNTLMKYVSGRYELWSSLKAAKGAQRKSCRIFALQRPFMKQTRAFSRWDSENGDTLVGRDIYIHTRNADSTGKFYVKFTY